MPNFAAMFLKKSMKNSVKPGSLKLLRALFGPPDQQAALLIQPC
jgi:hypothetical protein